MDDGSFFSVNSTMAETPMDLDYMDELLLEGCWLETAAGSNFLQNSTPLSSSLFDPSFSWSNIESTNNNNNELESSINPIQNYSSSSPSSSSLLDVLPTTQWLTSQNATEVPDPTRRLWIGPRSNNAGSVMDRLIWALNYIRDSSRNKDALVQVWIPVNSGGKRVLSTSNQPFSLDLNIPSLASYREISMNYQFPTDGNSNHQIEGLPGRVFKDKVPEWTPDVRFFTNNEYARVNDAQRFGVRGTLAVPVFEQGSHSCLGVIEVVTTAQKANYRPELESVCQALQAVDLRTTSEVVSDNANKSNVTTTYQAALPEILRVLASACSTHGLPLAQTWVSCAQQGKGGTRHSHENYARCVSTVDSACYVADASFRPFLEACSEHHLLKGQGVAGRAFTTNQPCFSPDVTSFSKTEYPLSHHARMFGLRAAVAIRLRSMNTGSSDFVLEFFLPKNCIDPEEQKELLTSLSTIIQNVCWSLRVVTDKEIEEDEEQQQQQQGDEQEEEEELEVLPVDKFVIEENAVVTNKASGGGGDRRRTKAEKAITLQVLQQYFSGSLKDAARKIGVCPTTLKRICRQHGITRWPSRKLKKVGHSLQKLQHVIDSVQGTSGTLQIGSFYSSFPALASPNISRTSPFVTTTMTTKNPADEQRKQSSSGSHSSSSSQCCSTASQPKLAVEQNTTIKKETAGSSGSSLKRARSEAGMHVSNDGDHFLPRSHSHKLLNEDDQPPRFEGLQPVVVAVVDVKAPPPPPPRIKVAYGEEKIRFRLQSHWRYKDLTREINRRFGIEDGNDGFHLKYLDDDFEWVLLTCDADLQECVDVSRSSLGDTIKLSLVRISSSS